jgi:transposase
VNILRLPDLAILNVEEQPHDLHVYAEVAEKLTRCANCNSPLIVGYGKREQRFMDLPMQAKRVGIYVDRRRFKCRSCGQTFMESVPGMDDEHKMTLRLVSYVRSQSVARTFTSLAADVGVDEKTVRNIFRSFIAEKEKNHKFQTPEWLGIDEVHILKKPRCILTNVKEQCVVDLLKDRNKATLQLWLARLKDKNKVKLVTMDMWKPYRDLVAAILPESQVVVDKFHVVRMASASMERVRKEIRMSLTDKQRKRLMHDRFILLSREKDLDGFQFLTRDAWFATLPKLKRAYELKEQFYQIFDLPVSGDDALAAYRSWECSIPDDLREPFSEVTTALTNWQSEIFSYFDHKATNAYTEGVNGLVKLLQRTGRGYSFDAIRAKLLYSKEAQKQPKFQPRYSSRPDYVCERFIFPQAVDDTPYGVDISTLLHSWEELSVEPESTT